MSRRESETSLAGENLNEEANDEVAEVRLTDALDKEASYYISKSESLLKCLIDNDHKKEFIVWFNHFANPIVNAQLQELRAKRNRYLFLMMMALLNNDIKGFLKTAALPHLQIDKKKKVAPVRGLASFNPQKEKISNSQGMPNSLSVAICPTKFAFPENPNPEWERENHWESVLEAIKAAQTRFPRSVDILARNKMSKQDKVCSYHGDKCLEIKKKLKEKMGTRKQETVQNRIEKSLDMQFSFLVSLAVPYIQFLPNSTDTASLWLRSLCEIDQSSCLEMKGIRNDYMTLFVGYLSNNHLVGPFQAVPMKPLPSLYETSDSLEKKMCFEPNLSLLPLNPVSGTIEDFMNEVPQIDEGAFAFIALSGSLFGYPTN